MNDANFELLLLQSKLNDLRKQREAIDNQVNDVVLAIQRIQLDAYPHKVGDIIESRDGPVKIVELLGGLDGVFPRVVDKLKGGGWSKRKRFVLSLDEGR